MTDKQVRNLIADASDVSDQVSDFIDYLGDDNHIAIDIIDGMIALGIGASEGKGIVFLDAESAGVLSLQLAKAVTALASS